jgi:acyl-CoA dehydrogenase
MLLLRLPRLLSSRGHRAISFSLTEEQLHFQSCVRRFAADEMMPRSLHHDHSAQWSREVFQKAWECGLVNLHIPKQYGGRGLGGIEGVIACEEMAFADIGMMIGMEINSVAEVPVILAGTEEQKRSFLGRMTANPLQAAYAVTEPGAGSDVAGVQTRADKKGDEWVLNGSKVRATWI